MKARIFLFVVFLGVGLQLYALTPSKELWSVIDVYRAITESYVDSLSEEVLAEQTIENMLKQLDPHSAYIPPEELEQSNESINGNFEGIGISYQLIDDTLTVIQTITGCPAEKAGVLPGDKVVAVNDTTIAGVKMTTASIAKRIRGPRGSEVKLKVLRGKGMPIIFIIIRDKIPVNTLDVAYRIDASTVYISTNSFGENTLNEIYHACDSLKLWDAENVILDLQDNGGGLLRTAIHLSDEFLRQGKLIVYTEGDKQPRRDDYATSTGRWEKAHLYILVNEYTASASEIVSGAIQDNDRGLIIGRRTFGKGLVQRPVPLRNGGVVRLTIARYYTPSGRCIQKSYSNGFDQYKNDLEERYKHGEFTSADSIHFADSLKYETLRLHRTIYGGGGIMPDIFIPFDTSRTTNYHRDLVAKGCLNKVVTNYVLRNSKSIKRKYGNFDNYNANFVVPEVLLNSLVEEGKKLDIAYNDEQFQTSKSYIMLQMKAIIARDIWNSGDYFKVMNVMNEPLQKALEIIREGRLDDYLGNKNKQNKQ